MSGSQRPLRRMMLLATAAAALCYTDVAHAQQNRTAQIDQLLRQLEQQQRQIETLRRQIEQIRQAQQTPPPQPAAPATAPAPAARPAGAPAPAGTPVVVTAGDRPGTIKIPGTDLSFRVGGFAKADFIHSFGAIAPGAQDLFAQGAIPTRAGSNRTGDRTSVHARESRLLFEAFHPTPIGQGSALVELDLFGAAGTEIQSNRTQLSLRHAKVEVGPLLVGQWWGTFSDPS